MGACLISAGGQNKKTEEALLHIKCNIYPAYSRHSTHASAACRVRKVK